MADRSAPATLSPQPTADGIPSSHISIPPSAAVDTGLDDVNEKPRSSSSTDLEAGSVTDADKASEAHEKKDAPSATSKQPDPNLVTWDSPDDPYVRPSYPYCMCISFHE